MSTHTPTSENELSRVLADIVRTAASQPASWELRLEPLAPTALWADPERNPWTMGTPVHEAQSAWQEACRPSVEDVLTHIDTEWRERFCGDVDVAVDFYCDDVEGKATFDIAERELWQEAKHASIAEACRIHRASFSATVQS